MRKTNTKYETRNSKQTRNTKFEIQKVSSFVFYILNLVRISCFGFRVLILTTVIFFNVCPVWARIYIPVDQPSDKRFPIAITMLVPLEGGNTEEMSVKIPTIIKNDLIISGYFDIIPDSAFLDRSTAITANAINFAQWTAIEAGAVVKGSVKKESGKYVVQLKLFDPYSEQMLVGKQYTAEARDIRSVAHRFSDEIMETLTGRRGIFNTRIAYTAFTGRANNKAIYIMDIDGENNQRITRDSSLNLGPSWSPDGSKLVYASYQKGPPEIFSVDLGNGQITQLTKNKSTSITPVWHPDGKTVYYSTSLTGSTEIFSTTAKGMQQEVTAVGGINIAPRFSKDGSTMVYSSTRAGRLHVYRQPTSGGSAQRLTFVGLHNDSPDISPDGNKIVFCGQDSGAFDIFIMNSDGTNIQRLTIDSGSNEHPRWSPDGRYIVFSSTRTGGPAIYMMRADGANQVRISKGNGSLPDWGPSVR